jgi:hypothetical protein
MDDQLSEFSAMEDVQWFAGKCAGAADILEGLLLEFDDPIVMAWANGRIAELRERMNEVESFARIMGGSA